MPYIPRIIMTVGEPAGIGPDIILKVAGSKIPAELIVVTDPSLLEGRAKQLDCPVQLVPFNAKSKPEARPNELKIIPVPLSVPSGPGKLNSKNANFVLACLELAAEHCMERITDALVTGPIHKAIINQSGFAFTGHTEFLAEFCSAPDVLMLFVVGPWKVALATTHLPLSEVPKAITTAHLLKSLRLLNREMQRLFQLKQPKIMVSGLNPHAGENGLLGTEEIEIISPALDLLRKEGIDCRGPFPADTLFIEKNRQAADVLFCMYHDQALPVVKHIGFDQAVNVTLGLPIIRTSVDHGTALPLAGTGQADPGSLQAAIQWAIQLARAPSPSFTTRPCE